MTLLTSPVRFGSVVKHRVSGHHFLLVGWADNDKHIAECARPDGSEFAMFRHNLIEVKAPRKWVPRGRRNTNR